ncbi:MAG: ribose 5-phosphate isomerase B [Bacteroidales bacterium]|nr:ribose 5-phosphate isomerase B [Bacteroidales bacterium]MCR5193329.1 ribose 5-phosphate isomerase B [Bacteroidales bacterium]
MRETIPIASDHAGYELKKIVIDYLKSKNYDVEDMGTYSSDSVDYPDFAHKVGSVINNGTYKRGIVICGSGNGVQMTVNKYPNVRCALCWNEEIAKLGRQHNDANIISMPARFVSTELALSMVDIFLNTEFEGGRHLRRVEKINKVNL